MRAAQRRTEGAVRRDHGGAEHAARGIAHRDGGTWFAGAGQRHAVGCEQQVTRGLGRGHVGRGVGRRRRGGARGIGLDGREGFAIELCIAQGDGEGAVGTDRRGAQDVAIGATDGDRGPWLADTGEDQAIGTECQVRRGVRRIGADRCKR